MSRPPRPADPAWLAAALTALRACCAEAGGPVTKDQFSAWSHARRPFYGPERMVKRGGKSWLVWLNEAGYPPRPEQIAAGKRTVPGSGAQKRREREAKWSRSNRPCLNDAAHPHPREGNRYCESCHRAWESVG